MLNTLKSKLLLIMGSNPEEFFADSNKNFRPSEKYFIAITLTTLDLDGLDDVSKSNRIIEYSKRIFQTGCTTNPDLANILNIILK